MIFGNSSLCGLTWLMFDFVMVGSSEYIFHLFCCFQGYYKILNSLCFFVCDDSL